MENPQIQIPSQPAKGKIKPFLVLLVLVIVVIAAGFYVFTGKKNASVPAVKNSDSQQNSVIKAENPETKDWAVYKNTEYGFEFEYPNDYFLNEDYDSVGYGSGVAFDVDYTLNLSKCFEEYYLGSKDCERGFRVFVISKSQQTLRDVSLSVVAKPDDLSAENEKYIFLISADAASSKDLIKKVHTTFSTIPIQDTVSGDSITYRNERFGFELSYPSYFGDFRPASFAEMNSYDLVARNFPVGSKPATLTIDIIRGHFIGNKLFDNYGESTYFDTESKIFYTLRNSQKVLLEKQFVNGNLFICDSTGEGTDEGWGVNTACMVYNEKHDYILKIELPLGSGTFYSKDLMSTQNNISSSLNTILKGLKFTK